MAAFDFGNNQKWQLPISETAKYGRFRKLRGRPGCPFVPKWHDTHGDVRTISDTLYPAAAVDRLYCSGLIQPSDSFGLSSL